ncbi:MAG TPA: hypothetical protein VN682_16980 [Terriglobales bacterium]|nr:hypothetical protein [Terriglobales bacterium]
MTGDQLIVELASIVETTCYPRFDRVTGDQQPITREEWDIVADKVLMLCARNKPKEAVNGNH